MHLKKYIRLTFPFKKATLGNSGDKIDENKKNNNKKQR